MTKKLLFLTLFVIIITRISYGTVYIVSNSSDKKEQFSSIQSAIEFANPHDTILVMGSDINYGNVILEKPLTLIASGVFNDDHTGSTSKLTRVLLTANPYRRTISSGSKIIGFEFPYFPGQRPNIITVTDYKARIKNVVIEKNWLWFVEIAGSAQNWTFRHNIVRGWVDGGIREGNSLAGATDFFFYNNVLNSLKGFEKGSVEIHNNLVFGRLQDVKNASVMNNIFTREEFILENVVSSSFYNNISLGDKIGNESCYEHPDRFVSMDKCTQSNNSGSGNLVGVDPLFAYWPIEEVESIHAFQLADSSPASRLSKDGTQAGIFGGAEPFPLNGFLVPDLEDPFPTFVTSIY